MLAAVQARCIGLPALLQHNLFSPGACCTWCSTPSNSNATSTSATKGTDRAQEQAWSEEQYLEDYADQQEEPEQVVDRQKLLRQLLRRTHAAEVGSDVNGSSIKHAGCRSQQYTWCDCSRQLASHWYSWTAAAHLLANACRLSARHGIHVVPKSL